MELFLSRFLGIIGLCFGNVFDVFAVHHVQRVFDVLCGRNVKTMKDLSTENLETHGCDDDGNIIQFCGDTDPECTLFSGASHAAVLLNDVFHFF